VVLAGEELGGGHDRGLGAGFDRAQHGQGRDEGLAGADIALQQAEHAGGGGEVGVDFGEDVALARGEGVAEAREGGVAQLAGAGEGATGNAAFAAADKRDLELVRQEFVVGQTVAQGRGRDVGGRVQRAQRLGEGGPGASAMEGGVLPFRQVRQAGQCGGKGAAQVPGKQARGEAPDRLDRGKLLRLVGGDDEVRRPETITRAPMGRRASG
jgi:hypothetical protein